MHDQNAVKWTDKFGEVHMLVAGQNDDVFHVIPNRRDDEGNSYVQILSKKAIIQMAEKLGE